MRTFLSLLWTDQVGSTLSAEMALVTSVTIGALFMGMADFSAKVNQDFQNAAHEVGLAGTEQSSAQEEDTVVRKKKPESEKTLKNFVARTSPPGKNWSRFEGPDHVPDGHSAGRDLLQAFLGCIVIIGILLTTGYFLYGNYATSGILLVITAASSTALFRSFKK